MNSKFTLYKTLNSTTICRGLIDIMTCETDEELESMAPNFTATTSHFGLVQEVELGQGGEERKVTLENRKEFIYKLYNWYLTGELIRYTRNLQGHGVCIVDACMVSRLLVVDICQ